MFSRSRSDFGPKLAYRRDRNAPKWCADSVFLRLLIVVAKYDRFSRELCNWLPSVSRKPAVTCEKKEKSKKRHFALVSGLAIAIVCGFRPGTATNQKKRARNLLIRPRELPFFLFESERMRVRFSLETRPFARRV